MFNLITFQVNSLRITSKIPIILPSSKSRTSKTLLQNNQSKTAGTLTEINALSLEKLSVLKFHSLCNFRKLSTLVYFKNCSITISSPKSVLTPKSAFHVLQSYAFHSDMYKLNPKRAYLSIFHSSYFTCLAFYQTLFQ